MRSKYSSTRTRSSGTDEARTRSTADRGPYKVETEGRGRTDGPEPGATAMGPATKVKARASIGSDARKHHSPAESGAGRATAAVCEMTDHPAGATTRTSTSVGPARRKHGITGAPVDGPRLR